MASAARSNTSERNEMAVKERTPLERATRKGLTAAPGGLGTGRVLEIQRVRVLAAMVEECADRGAGNVTVAHVVARAGVSRRTFYELFVDREDCFLQAFEEGVAHASRIVLDGYDPKARWVERVRTALSGLLAFLDAEPDIGQLLMVGSLGVGAKALEYRRHVLHQAVALVDEGRGEAKGSAQPLPLMAEGVVGGVLSVVHSRLLAIPQSSSTDGPSAGELPGESSLLDLAGPLMGMIVLPYLGPATARRELGRPVPKPMGVHRQGRNPLGELEMRLTYRTVRVMAAIAACPGSSNRVIAEAAEVTDQGQMSKLLARLNDIGLIENAGGGAVRGEPNAWTLTDKGWRVHSAIAEQTTSI